MSHHIGLLLAIGFVSVAAQGVRSFSAPDEPVRRTANDLREVELLAFHDLRGSYGFTTGTYGHVEIQGTIYNRNSQIAFVTQPVDRLLVSLNGGERGAIIDIGDNRTNTNSSEYWSLASQLHRNELVPVSPFGGAEVHVGHNYLAVIKDISESGLDVPKGGTLYVKLRVIEHVKGQYVRFIWEPLE